MISPQIRQQTKDKGILASLGTEMTCVGEGSAEQRNVVAYADNIFNMASIRMDTQDKANIEAWRAGPQQVGVGWG